MEIDYYHLLMDHSIYDGIRFQTEEEKQTTKKIELVKKKSRRSWVQRIFEREYFPEDVRERMVSTIAAGLLVNVLLTIGGILAYVVLWQFGKINQVVNSIVVINLSLIALNVLPVKITDGYKLLSIHLPERTRMKELKEKSSEKNFLFVMLVLVSIIML